MNLRQVTRLDVNTRPQVEMFQLERKIHVLQKLS